MPKLTDQRLILIAGPIRAGKSTLAKRVAEHFGGARVSFGDAVRHRTLTLGLLDERSSWQEVGAEWVARDPEGLIDAVLAPAAEAVLVVVDGLRHRHVHDLLRARTASSRVVLVFVDTDMSIRQSRLGSDGIGDEAITQALHHSTEHELQWLRESADIVADGTRDAAQVLVALDALIAGDADQNSL